MRAVTVSNQKGGVGKSTTTNNVAAELARRGHPTLLIDCDEQGSTTQGHFGPAAYREMDPGATVAAVFAGAPLSVADLARPTAVARLDLVAASPSLARHNRPDPETLPEAAQGALAAFLADGGDAYDFVLIDTPPNLNLCAWAALAASDAYIIPTAPEEYDMQGIGPVLGFAARVRSASNPRLRELGILIGKVDLRYAVHATYRQVLRDQYGALVFDAIVRRCVDFPEALASRRAVPQHRPRGTAAADIKALVAEILARLESVPSPEAVTS